MLLRVRSNPIRGPGLGFRPAQKHTKVHQIPNATGLFLLKPVAPDSPKKCIPHIVSPATPWGGLPYGACSTLGLNWGAIPNQTLHI